MTSHQHTPIHIEPAFVLLDMSNITMHSSGIEHGESNRFPLATGPCGINSHGGLLDTFAAH